MPHCIIEHSSDLESETLMSLVFSGANASGLFGSDGKDIKVRAIPYCHHQTGKVKNTFVHVSLKILSGRNDEQKITLSRLVVEKLQSLPVSNCSITSEVIDMERTTYLKILV